jgi:hypothetical protein
MFTFIMSVTLKRPPAPGNAASAASGAMLATPAPAASTATR